MIFLCEAAKLAVEIGGYHRLSDKKAHRRDRCKDELLQENGYFTLRFLTKAVMTHLGAGITRIIRYLSEVFRNEKKCDSGDLILI